MPPTFLFSVFPWKYVITRSDCRWRESRVQLCALFNLHSPSHLFPPSMHRAGRHAVSTTSAMNRCRDWRLVSSRLPALSAHRHHKFRSSPLQYLCFLNSFYGVRSGCRSLCFLSFFVYILRSSVILIPSRFHDNQTVMATTAAL